MVESERVRKILDRLEDEIEHSCEGCNQELIAHYDHLREYYDNLPDVKQRYEEYLSDHREYFERKC